MLTPLVTKEKFALVPGVKSRVFLHCRFDSMLPTCRGSPIQHRLHRSARQEVAFDVLAAVRTLLKRSRQDEQLGPDVCSLPAG
jgi:hypothetical protein